tara:strand:+ start:34 stop:612 length:579 start_codon:yes stop_codon:yes gene_type:complete
MSKSKLHLANLNTRRRLVREFLASMEEAKGALKTAWRQEPPHRWANRLATSTQNLSEVWGGSEVNLEPFRKALEGGKWKAASKALAKAAESWCKWAEKQGAWGEIPGWMDSQRPRVIRTCSMDGWLTKAEEKAKEAPKAAPKAKAPAKAQKASKAAPSAPDGMDKLLSAMEVLVTSSVQTNEKLDKLVDALV